MSEVTDSRSAPLGWKPKRIRSIYSHFSVLWTSKRIWFDFLDIRVIVSAVVIVLRTKTKIDQHYYEDLRARFVIAIHVERDKWLLLNQSNQMSTSGISSDADLLNEVLNLFRYNCPCEFDASKFQKKSVTSMKNTNITLFVIKIEASSSKLHFCVTKLTFENIIKMKKVLVNSFGRRRILLAWGIN